MSTTSQAESSSSDPCLSLKECSSCHVGRAEGDFSGAQLKKKGKRVCARCVDKREALATFTSQISAASTTTVYCQSCGKKCDRVAPCRVCQCLCCGIDCFTAHRGGGASQCDAVFAMPQLDITAKEDLLTADDIRTLWPQFLRRMSSIARQVEGCQAHVTLFESKIPHAPLFPRGHLSTATQGYVVVGTFQLRQACCLANAGFLGITGKNHVWRTRDL